MMVISMAHHVYARPRIRRLRDTLQLPAFSFLDGSVTTRVKRQLTPLPSPIEHAYTRSHLDSKRRKAKKNQQKANSVAGEANVCYVTGECHFTYLHMSVASCNRVNDQQPVYDCNAYHMRTTAFEQAASRVIRPRCLKGKLQPPLNIRAY